MKSIKSAMKNVILMAAIACAAFAVTGCGQGGKLSFDSVESGRMQANENSEFNARAFRQNHTEYSGLTINTRGDSTQSAECGQGDGWASIDLLNVETGAKVPLKCSTTSAATGCMTKADFDTRAYAKQEGSCDDAIPFPLPKIQK